MTLEELLSFDSEQFKAMSDQELLEYFQPVLSVTRPEAAVITKAIAASPKMKQVPVDNRKAAVRAEAADILKKLGMDLKF